MQKGVGDPAEAVPELPGTPPADDQQVRLVGGGRQHSATRSLGRTAAQAHVRRGVGERGLQLLGRPFLVKTLGRAREQRVVDRVVGGASPCPYRVQGGAAPPGLLAGEAHRSGGRVGHTHHDAAAPAATGGTVVVVPRVTTTGQSDMVATVRLTEPSSRPASSPRPRVPRITADALRASRRRTYSGSSAVASVVTARSGW